MGGVSPETCWASYKYEIKFWYTVASCWISYVNYTLMHGSTNIKSSNFLDRYLKYYYFLFFLTVWGCTCRYCGLKRIYNSNRSIWWINECWALVEWWLTGESQSTRRRSFSTATWSKIPHSDFKRQESKGTNKKEGLLARDWQFLMKLEAISEARLLAILQYRDWIQFLPEKNLPKNSNDPKAKI